MKPLLLAVMLFAPATAWTQTPALDGTWVGSWQTRGGQTGQLVLHLTQMGDRVIGAYDTDKTPSGTVRGMRVQGTLNGDQLHLMTRDSSPLLDGKVEGTTLSGTFFGRKAIKSFTVTKEKRG
ncbi:MAG: hypothetical protein HY953_09065 [Candidatus Rokubacteria bacterium]|nr:hypothetical protein [Candidatus Rokubacteria bacterium]